MNIDVTSFTTIIVVIVVLYLISSIKILREYERGVIFRLGRLLPQPKGPGIILVFAPIDRMVRVSLRVDTLEVPAQDVITRDNVTVKVNAVIYFRVVEPRLAVVEVSNFLYATSQLAQTTLRSVLGEVELDELLSQREKLNIRLQSILDQHTSPWGVKVTMVEVKQVDLAEAMIRAMARQDHPRGRRVLGVGKAGHGCRGNPETAGGHPVAVSPDLSRNRDGEEYDYRFPPAAGYTCIIQGRPGPIRQRQWAGRSSVVKHAQQGNRRIRTGGGRPATAQRILYRSPAPGRSLRHGLRVGAELSPIHQTGDGGGRNQYRCAQPPAAGVSSRAQTRHSGGGHSTRRHTGRSHYRGRCAATADHATGARPVGARSRTAGLRSGFGG